MACARFYSEMYHSFLVGKITIPEDPRDYDIKEYPHYSLFMAIHLGEAFGDATIISNVEAISSIPKEELLSWLEVDSTGHSIFNKTLAYLVSLGIYPYGDRVWD